MRRWGTVTATALLAGVGLLGLAGCGAAGGPVQGSAEETAIEVAAAMGADGQALAAMGFNPEDIAGAEVPAVEVADPAASPSAGPAGERGERGEGWRKRHPARVLLRRNTLHGEAVVQTKAGTKTVTVQRGEVTAIDADSMTVKSTDGFTMTWTFGDKLRVVERRKSVQPDQVAVGAQVGVAGTRDGDQSVAGLIIVPREK